MLHIIIEVVENYEGLTIKGTRKFGTGESLRSHHTPRKDLEQVVETKEIFIKDCVSHVIDTLTKD
ncbi:hypothetical protein A2Z56_02580 [Candidatus Kaiserbacteria bacterium RIFCSPHIGHO2_12_45_16]|nr:MAG: hypothetical protein A2Z56_02580 [Candidatus Kaiserbacteria bacterium RIFCSPHIGHO2_12_45_16]